MEPTRSEYRPGTPARNSGMALASLILGILSLFLWLLTSIAAIITGHMALSRIQKSSGQLSGKGLAVAGLVLGYITTVLGGIVAVIVAATAILTLKATDSLSDNARIMRADGDFAAFESSFMTYRLLTGNYPTQEQGFQALVARPVTPPIPKRWERQLDSIPEDPWGSEYIYRFPGTKDPGEPEIISFGPDAIEGTGDDLSSQD